ncbi:MAG: hypothetical protein KIPDCIKN_00439 [Haliscomenobacter sp.]|jgi:hypothetical protein|nr:hypothetical protein [Haliscomenobacter sp.]
MTDLALPARLIRAGLLRLSNVSYKIVLNNIYCQVFFFSVLFYEMNII